MDPSTPKPSTLLNPYGKTLNPKPLWHPSRAPLKEPPEKERFRYMDPSGIPSWGFGFKGYVRVSGLGLGFGVQVSGLGLGCEV